MATSLPPQSLYSSDNEVKTVLHNLANGIRSITPGSYGRWNDTIEQVLTVYDRSGGSKEHTQRAIQLLCKRNPELNDLLREEVEIPDTEEQETRKRKTKRESILELAFCPPLSKKTALPPELANGACPVLDKYVTFSRYASPQGYDDFHTLSGIWLLSVIAGRRISLRLGPQTFYPNLMITLCAKPGQYAKSTTARIATSVLSAMELDYMLLPAQISPQRLLTVMSSQYIPERFKKMTEKMKKRTLQKLALVSQKGWFDDEIGMRFQSIDRASGYQMEMQTILLRMEGGEKYYEASTQTRGDEVIEDPFLSVLGTSTPANLERVGRYRSEYWNNGLFSRFIFSYPLQDMNSEPVPFSNVAQDIPPDIIEYLKHWHDELGVPHCDIVPELDDEGNITGSDTIVRDEHTERVYTLSQDAYAAWSRYYIELNKIICERSNTDLHASYIRLTTIVLRIALLLASVSGATQVELWHYAKAQEITERLRKSMHVMYCAINFADVPEDKAFSVEDDIIRYLTRIQGTKWDNPTIAQMHSRNLKSKGISMKALTESMRVLVQEGVINQTVGERTTRYTLSERTIAEYDEKYSKVETSISTSTPGVRVDNAREKGVTQAS